MTVESATYLDDLDPSYPAGGDDIPEGDNHIRLLKSVLKATFPSVAGAVSASHTELGYSAGVTSGIQAQLDALSVLIAANTAAIAALEGLEVGDIKLRGVATAGSGWLECDGSAVSRTTYAALFAAYSTTFGAGDGSTTFNLPDLRGRAPVGVGTGDAVDATAVALADKFGTEGHTLTVDELASHLHVQTNAGSRGDLVGGGSTSAATAGSGNTGSAGGDQPHENRGPRLGLHFYCYAGA